MSTINCPGCGQPNADIARICRYCGSSLIADFTSSQQQRPPDYAPPPPQTDFGGIPLWATNPPPAPIAPLAQPNTPENFHCPHCQSTAPPVIAKRIGVAGWVVFFALLIFCFPLCFIGLFIKEEYRMCSWCRGAIA